MRLRRRPPRATGGGVGHEAVVERQLRGRQRPDAHLLDCAPDGEALGVALDQEDGELLLFARLAKTVKKSATGAEVIQVLLPVQDVAAVDLARVVAIDPRSLPASGSVMQIVPIFSPRKRRLEQPLEDVGVAEQVQEVGAHQRLHRRAAGERHRAARDLLEREAERRRARMPLPPTSSG